MSAWIALGANAAWAVLIVRFLVMQTRTPHPHSPGQALLDLQPPAILYEDMTSTDDTIGLA